MLRSFWSLYGPLMCLDDGSTTLIDQYRYKFFSKERYNTISFIYANIKGFCIPNGTKILKKREKHILTFLEWLDVQNLVAKIGSRCGSEFGCGYTIQWRGYLGTFLIRKCLKSGCRLEILEIFWSGCMTLHKRFQLLIFKAAWKVVNIKSACFL